MIDSFVAAYKRQVDFYLEAARICKSRCENLLKENGIRAIVSYRAKSPERLREKLEHRNGEHYTSHEAIYNDIVDLAGVRIALYFPGDREQVHKLVLDAFDLLETPREFPTEASPRSGQKFSGYHATHYRVKLQPEDVSEEQRRYAEAPIEIQVASVLMHAWAEVEHDLVYKPSSGALSEDEYAILDQLNGLVLSGETALELLQRAVKKRVATGGGEFANQYELAAFLVGQLQRSQPSMIGPKEPIMGRVDLLLDLIRRGGLDSPDALAPYIAALDPDTEKRPIAEQTVDKLLAVRKDLNDVWITLQAAQGDTTSRISAEAHELLGRFVSQWLVLERFLERLWTPKLKAGSHWPAFSAGALKQIFTYYEIDQRLAERLISLRFLRNQVMHGRKVVDIATLRAAIDETEKTIFTFRNSSNPIVADAMKWACSEEGSGRG